MAPSISSQSLLKELNDSNDFFDQLVDMIPARLYVAGHSGDDFNPKYFKGQAKESKEARRAQSKQAKRVKLDPSLTETTTQVKKRLEGEGSTRPSLPAPVTPDAPDSAIPAPPTTDNQSRIEALRAKLRAKLTEKRGQRPADPNTVSKRAARRAEKKKRQEEAAQRKKKAQSRAESSDNSKKYQVGAQAAMNDPAADLAQVDFGLLTGLNKNKSSNYLETNKSLANMGKTKNLQKLLADAEAKKERLEELKQSASEADKEKAANMEWGDAIKEAAGDRVKDDPAKLKKALKRQTAKKTKSAKAWKSRMTNTKEKMDERQKIRQHNLSKRKQGGTAGANLSKKRIVTEEEKAAGGKRQSRAGFEGRKQDFLNDKKKGKNQ